MNPKHSPPLYIVAEHGCERVSTKRAIPSPFTLYPKYPLRMTKHPSLRLPSTVPRQWSAAGPRVGEHRNLSTNQGRNVCTSRHKDLITSRHRSLMYSRPEA